MSYTSTNKLAKDIKLERLYDVLSFLGYKQADSTVLSEVPNFQRYYYWDGDNSFDSLVGIELSVYMSSSNIEVSTRTRASRSYFDVKHQNKTIKAILDFFGGEFETDAGIGVYIPEDENVFGRVSTVLETGLYHSLWVFNNSVIKTEIFQQQFNRINRPIVDGDLSWLNEVNPNIIGDNMQIPVLVGAWEHYFRTTFVALIKSSENRKDIYKRMLRQIKLTCDDVESFSNDSDTIEWVLADNLSFQRPSIIIENYKMIDDKILINNIFKKPLANQTIPLWQKLEEIIEIRNQIVHCGKLGFIITADDVTKILIEGVMRAYEEICKYYSLLPEYDGLTVFPVLSENDKEEN